MKKTSKNSGFSFIEVMIATLVAGITLGGVLTSVLFATRLNYASSQQYSGFALCKERIEELREMDFDTLTDTYEDKAGVRYQFNEFNQVLTMQGSDGTTAITGTRRTDVWDYRNHVRYPGNPHYYVRVRFTWNSQSQVNLNQNRVELWSRIYPR